MGSVQSGGYNVRAGRPAVLAGHRPHSGVFGRTWLAAVVIGILVITGVAAPLVSPESPTASSIRDRNTPPMWFPEGNSDHILGADQQGRDVLSRVVYGGTISLFVALAVIVSDGFVGVSSGLIAGYLGGFVDELIMRTVDLFYAVPGLLVILVFVIVFGQSFGLLVFLLALFSWMHYARQVRGETLQLKTLDYVSYARVSGTGTVRILIRHILPGVANTVMIVASLQVGGVILTEATLSFLGVGVPPPTPSWGSMVSDGRNYLADAWWIAMFPGVAIFMVVMACFFFADWARDRLDPRLRQL